MPLCAHAFLSKGMTKAGEDEDGKHPAVDAAGGSALRSAAGCCLHLAGDR